MNLSSAENLLLLVLVGLGVSARGDERTVPDQAYDPALPYQAERLNPVTYDVDYSVVVTPPYHTKRLRIWLPLPQSDAGQSVSDSDLSSFPIESRPGIATEPIFGNRFAYFEFDNPEGAQQIRHRFRIKVWELRWHLDSAKVVDVAKWPASFEPYLRGKGQAVVVNDRVRAALGEIVPERRGDARDLASVIAWINGRMKYDHDAASLQASAIQALESGRGHCSDYHGLCAAFGRALGYPTRITYGINPLPKNSPSHCKLEAYLPPYGWVSFDVSETQRLIGAITQAADLDETKKESLIEAAQRRLDQGFRDNTWFLQTRGTDYDLVPPASQRVPVVRTIYAEADGVALPDPDPANSAKREFAWMTVHKYVPDRPVTYPFRDWKSLENQQ